MPKSCPWPSAPALILTAALSFVTACNFNQDGASSTVWACPSECAVLSRSNAHRPCLSCPVSTALAFPYVPICFSVTKSPLGPMLYLIDNFLPPRRSGNCILKVASSCASSARRGTHTPGPIPTRFVTYHAICTRWPECTSSSSFSILTSPPVKCIRSNKDDPRGGVNMPGAILSILSF